VARVTWARGFETRHSGIPFAEARIPAAGQNHLYGGRSGWSSQAGTLCEDSWRRRGGRGGRGGKKSGARRAWQRSVSVSPTEVSVELDDSLSESCETEKAREEKELWGREGGAGLAIGIVVRLDKAVGGIEVGESALISGRGEWGPVRR